MLHVNPSAMCLRTSAAGQDGQLLPGTPVRAPHEHGEQSRALGHGVFPGRTIVPDAAMRSCGAEGNRGLDWTGMISARLRAWTRHSCEGYWQRRSDTSRRAKPSLRDNATSFASSSGMAMARERPGCSSRAWRKPRLCTLRIETASARSSGVRRKRPGKRRRGYRPRPHRERYAHQDEVPRCGPRGSAAATPIVRDRLSRSASSLSGTACGRS